VKFLIAIAALETEGYKMTQQPHQYHISTSAELEQNIAITGHGQANASRSKLISARTETVYIVLHSFEAVM
jgi:hypothetical protein